MQAYEVLNRVCFANILISRPKGRGIKPHLLVRRSEREGGLKIFRLFNFSTVNISLTKHDIACHILTDILKVFLVSNKLLTKN